jgi:nitrogen fixation/metabolism regulation signal transduction histidine kinase
MLRKRFIFATAIVAASLALTLLPAATGSSTNSNSIWVVLNVSRVALYLRTLQ